jgi:hypothetical protein
MGEVLEHHSVHVQWVALGNGSYKKVCGFCTFVHTTVFVPFYYLHHPSLAPSVAP